MLSRLTPSHSQAKLKVLGREAIVEVSPADEDYAAIGGA